MDIVIDGGSFGHISDDHVIALGGRACDVFQASQRRLRCRLARDAHKPSQPRPTFDDPLTGTIQRGLSLHVWHLSNLVSAAECLGRVTAALTEQQSEAFEIGELAACLAEANSLLTDGPLEGFRLPRDLRWPSYDLPKSLDFGPGLFLSPPVDGSKDVFVGAGSAVFHPPVSGWYEFHVHASQPTFFAVGNKTISRESPLPFYSTTKGAPMWLETGKNYPTVFATALDEHGKQARISVRFRSSERPNALSNSKSGREPKKKKSKGSPGLAASEAISLEAVPSTWFTSLQLHASRVQIVQFLEQYHGHKRYLDSDGQGTSFASLVVNGASSICRGTAPGACEFRIDEALKPTVSTATICGASSLDDTVLGLESVLAMGSNSFRIEVAGSGFDASRHNVSRSQVKLQPWERHGVVSAPENSFDPATVFALDIDGRERTPLCRGEFPVSATQFGCTVKLPNCDSENTTAALGAVRFLGVLLSGGGWAEFESPVQIPWPLPCAPAEDAPKNFEAALLVEARSTDKSRSLESSTSNVKYWSDVLSSDYGGAANVSDVTVWNGETLVIDADVDCQYLNIEGAVVWDTTVDGITLHAAGIIIVANGSFTLGTQESPMLLEANVVIKSLNETVSVAAATDGDDVVYAYDDPFQEYKVAVGSRPFVAYSLDGVSRPSIEIAGRPVVRTWTMLAKSVSAGESTLWLEHNPEALGWRVGDRVSIATSGSGSSVRVIQCLLNSTFAGAGGGLNLTEPVEYSYLGNLNAYYANRTIRMAVEVSLMSRSITITGTAFDFDKSIATGAIGMHMMVAFQGLLKMSYARVDTCGQSEVPGRYCIHMHVLKECPDCLIKGCAVEEGWHAGITIHGTHHSLTTENTLHNARGVGIYIEDGSCSMSLCC